MIETLISSKTRVKLLFKFFLNSNTTSYLRSLESEFGESSNAIRIELNRLEEAGMLSSSVSGNRKVFQANKSHPLFKEVHNILLKHIGLDRIIENVIDNLGEVEQVYVVGEFSKGIDSPVIDLVFLGQIDKIYLLNLIEKVEKLILRKIRYIVYEKDEKEVFDPYKLDTTPLLLWSRSETKE
jgi:hypothetical protein